MVVTVVGVVGTDHIVSRTDQNMTNEGVGGTDHTVVMTVIGVDGTYYKQIMTDASEGGTGYSVMVTVVGVDVISTGLPLRQSVKFHFNWMYCKMDKNIF